MPTLKTRTKRLHDAEVGRWRKAWTCFYDRHFGMDAVEEAQHILSLVSEHGETEAEESACDAAYAERAGAEAVEAIRAWLRTVRLPERFDKPELTLWPHLLPDLPETDAALLPSAASVVRAAWDALSRAEQEEEARALLTPDVVACACLLENARTARAIKAARSEWR